MNHTDNNKRSAPHICLPDCDCGMSRRDFLRLSSLTAAGAAAPLLFAGDAMAQQFKGDDVPVRIGYLPITDATALLVAHANKLFEAEGLTTEKPRLFRSWAQIVEAFVSGQVNVVHLLSPATLWVRYGSRFPAKIVAWNHLNGSALTVDPSINSITDLGGKTFAIPFWYSIHNVILQQLLRKNGLEPVSQPRGSVLQANQVNLVVLAPSEMVSALASKSIAGYIVADPFNAAAENLKIGKILRFTGDVWKNHACCVVTLAERDIAERPEWAQRVTNAIVKAQHWTRSNQLATAKLLSADGANKYTPHQLPVLAKVLAATDYASYEKAGIVKNTGWYQRRIDFQPFPYASYTEEMVRAVQHTRVEGDTTFLQKLDPKFAAKDLVDDRFVRKALPLVGGPAAFGIPPELVRKEIIAI
jgi:NitT/TauT family transport system substrate-binding protein